MTFGVRIPKEVKPSEIFELTKNLNGKSCYTFKSIAYIGFDNEEKMNAALTIPITYNGIALTAKVKGAAYIRKQDPHHNDDDYKSDSKHTYTAPSSSSPPHSLSHKGKSKNKHINTTPNVNKYNNNDTDNNTTNSPDKLDIILKQLQDLQQLHNKVNHISSIYDHLITNGLISQQS